LAIAKETISIVGITKSVYAEKLSAALVDLSEDEINMLTNETKFYQW
jgi:hypothetical protein